MLSRVATYVDGYIAHKYGVRHVQAVRDHDDICMQLVPDYSAQTVKHLWKGWKQSS